MPAGPAAGRVEAQRRALTTPSTAPASESRWCAVCIRVCERNVSTGNTCDAHELICVRFVGSFFPRISTRRCARGRRVLPARLVRADTDNRYDQRWRERPGLDGLGSLAGQNTGVVHAIVGSPAATLTLTVTAAQSAAAFAGPKKTLRYRSLHAVRVHGATRGERASSEGAKTGGPT